MVNRFKELITAQRYDNYLKRQNNYAKNFITRRKKNKKQGESHAQLRNGSEAGRGSRNDVAASEVGRVGMAKPKNNRRKNKDAARCLGKISYLCTMIRKNLHVAKPFRFEAGGEVPEIDICYHTSGDYSAEKKVVWICHALTANSDAEEWWPDLVGPGATFDTDRYFVCCVNMLGSCYGSSGPSSVNPKTRKPYMLSFPPVTVRDIINASILVRRHLGIDKIDLLVGASIGGFQALEWSIMEQKVISQAIFIATCARMNAWCGATLAAQRMALEADPTFLAERSLKGGRTGLKCARAQGLITYRTYDSFVLTQSERNEDSIFPERVESYEQYQGEKLVKRFDAYSYYSVVKSAESHNVGRFRGGVEKALGSIKAKSMVISINTDLLFPPKEMEQWAQFIPGAEYHEITSLYGHDGFLLEWQQLKELMKPYLP